MERRSAKPRIGLLAGDPTGIGPEVTAKLLALPETLEEADVTIVGDPGTYRRGCEVAVVAERDVPFVSCPAPAETPVGRVSVEAGAYTIATIRAAIDALKAGAFDALVYAPFNKQAMKLAGLGYDDELLFYASLLRHAGPLSEINVGRGLWTSRVTSHVPLREVADLITAAKIGEVAGLLHSVMQTAGIASPRLAVAALNPHAGEGGLLGTEELTVIGPAVEQLRAAGLNVTGPLPADTLFVSATQGRFDGVVTMYHDQGQIAIKLLGFDGGVTVSGGLPFPITTPAHGTAFDIAGKGVAKVGAMREAFSVACRMVATQAQQSASR